MRIIRVITVIMAVVFALNMAACCGPDNTTEVKKTEVINQPTVGQQLEDLDKAYKNGAITKEEYEKTKQEHPEQSRQPKAK
ncbi:MAG: SHOCT domain-containing protein [Bacillus subtilis]|nr:SHOCT domain-containing protein [Bacillus subtilis]